MPTKEYLNIPFEIKSIEESSNFFVFEGYASTFNNIDLGNDVVVKGAFTESLKKRPNYKILWQHDMRQPIGIPEVSVEDDKGLYIKARLPKDDTLVSGRVIPQIKVGSVDSMSIGFFIEDYEIKGDVRYLKKINLFEVSLVTMPMNEEATLSTYKAFAPNKNLPLADRDKEWDSNAAVKRIREFTKSTDEPSARYKRYFMYYDENNADKFGAYKLPFADVIDGEAMIVPKAIFAIAAVLNGARGGVDIPSTDRNKIINAINQLYLRMANEFDDESIISPLEKGKSFEDIQNVKDIETLLRSNGLSQNEAKTLISKIKEFSNQRDVGTERQRDVVESKLNTFFENQVNKKLDKIINNLNK